MPIFLCAFGNEWNTRVAKEKKKISKRVFTSFGPRRKINLVINQLHIGLVS